MEFVINVGSSSLKWAVFSQSSKVVSGVVESLHESPVLVCGSQRISVSSGVSSALSDVVSFLQSRRLLSDVSLVAHRVVHGGEEFFSPVQVSVEVLEKLTSLSSFAPLHNPHNIEGISAAQSIFPSAIHVAVFDTAFHSTLGKTQFLYPLPYEAYDDLGIRKFGFHGLSHSSVARFVQKKHGRHLDTVSVHLGSGCSVCAISDGRSVDTSMGFTPLDGLMMGTRCGSIDPGVIFFLQDKGFDVARLLNEGSGWYGVSGISDFRTLVSSSDERAQLAFEMFCYRAACEINKVSTALGSSFDALVFTGGVGANSSEARSRICSHLGISLRVVSAQTISSKPFVHVISSDEESELWLQACKVI